jgi:hypothetical protein
MSLNSMQGQMHIPVYQGENFNFVAERAMQMCGFPSLQKGALESYTFNFMSQMGVNPHGF